MFSVVNELVPIETMLKDLFAETLQQMMEAEMDTTLGYGPDKQTENRRNGHSKKTVVSEFGETKIALPWDRDHCHVQQGHDGV